MGNLPQISNSKKQEERSLVRFKSLFSENKFFIRDERKDDYGVDLRVELIFNQCNVTNITVDIQLKSIFDAEYDDKMGFCYSKISVCNLNYLLNSPYSMYVVYLEGKDIFLWDYCVNINKYCEQRSISIRTTNQKTISYNFKRILDSESIDEIHNEIKFRYNDLLQKAENNQLLTKRSSNGTDINISKNLEKTKEALKYYIDLIERKGYIYDLMQITLYNYSEIQHAKTNGILTSRLANGLISVIDANLSVLIGEKDLLEILEKDKYSISITTFDKFVRLIKESATSDEFCTKMSQKCISFDNFDSLQDRANYASRYAYMKKLNILNKLSKSDYDGIISLNINSRTGYSYKTVTQLYNYRFNDNYIENSDATFYNRYFILDFRTTKIIDGMEYTDEIYEVDLGTFYALISEICSAKQDIEDGIAVEEAYEYLKHMEGIVSELISIYNQR